MVAKEFGSYRQVIFSIVVMMESISKIDCVVCGVVSWWSLPDGEINCIESDVSMVWDANLSSSPSYRMYLLYNTQTSNACNIARSSHD